MRALGACGNATWASARAGVDKTTAYDLRKRNPAFAASWDRAMAKGRAGLAAGQAPPTDMLGDGREWSVRRSKSGRPCAMRTGPGRWSRTVEARFLGLLTATANVAAAARAIGMSTTGLYARRARDDAFRMYWDAALAEGYARIEMGMIARASAAVEPFDWIAEAGFDVETLPEMSTAEMLNLLKLHRAAVHGGRAQRYGWRTTEPDIEDVRAELLRKVAAWMGE